jgi:hypothetical protein
MRGRGSASVAVHPHAGTRVSEPPKRARKKAAGDARAWDKAVAAALPGNKLLAAIIYLAEDGSPLEQQQLFGLVESANERDGIVLELRGQRAGEKFVLPPDTRPIQEAMPGTYLLQSGEEVLDPDFTATFTVHGQKA